MLGADEDNFPASLPESDRANWSALTANQRSRARERLRAIEGWRAGDLSLEEAMAATDLSRTRFYAIAADFKAAPTLSSLGALAGSGASRERLNPDTVNALQSVVSDVVAMNRGASVSQLVRLMVKKAEVDPDSLPGATRLRGIVEAELRRVDASGLAGHALKLDMTAINIPGKDGRPHILFILIDEGSRLILGAATQGSTDLLVGYGAAARDATKRIKGSLAKIRWADRLMRIEATVGEDREVGAALRGLLIQGGVHANVNLAPERYGRYFRKAVGDRIGRIAITPLRTEAGLAVPDNHDMTPWTDAEATAAVALAVEQHNASVIDDVDTKSGRRVIPDDLAKALRVLSG